ncbi:hypothetical protein [Thermococcus sp.]|uniref:hypothetical protein n=1 Tax=Thermococcus sp. TaxID=35749 RepID=UPI0025D3D517|nr:hypothetical protein [Thermococcus sp.]
MVALALLPLAGMFIFGGKKTEEKRKESTVPNGLREKVSVVVQEHGKGLYYLLNRATPDQDLAKIARILDHDRRTGKPGVIQEAEYKKIRVRSITRRKNNCRALSSTPCVPRNCYGISHWCPQQDVCKGSGRIIKCTVHKQT